MNIAGPGVRADCEAGCTGYVGAEPVELLLVFAGEDHDTGAPAVAEGVEANGLALRGLVTGGFRLCAADP